jgi:hypothetical protein
LALVAAGADLHSAKIRLSDRPPRGLRVALIFDKTITAPAAAGQPKGGAHCAGLRGF